MQHKERLGDLLEYRVWIHVILGHILVDALVFLQKEFYFSLDVVDSCILLGVFCGRRRGQFECAVREVLQALYVCSFLLLLSVIFVEILKGSFHIGVGGWILLIERAQLSFNLKGNPIIHCKEPFLFTVPSVERG